MNIERLTDQGVCRDLNAGVTAYWLNPERELFFRLFGHWFRAWL